MYVFILLDVHWTFWIDGLVYDIPITFMLYFLKLSYSPWIFCSVFSVYVLFAFGFEDCHWDRIELKAFPSCVQSTNKPIKALFPLLKALFICSVSFWFFPRIFIFAHIILICSFLLSTLVIKVLSILIFCFKLLVW